MKQHSIMMADSTKTDQLSGKWLEILKAGTHSNETYDPADLDGMVSEYQSRAEGSKSPLVLGIPAQGKSDPVGKIDALRRVGSSLQAKLANVDPRVEYLHGRGVFPKQSVQVNRSPTGDKIQSVGLVHPVFYNLALHDGETPSLEELMKQNSGNKDHIFAGGSHFVNFETSLGRPEWEEATPSAASIVSGLKKRGYWAKRFDAYGIPSLFAALDHKPAARQFAEFLVLLMDKGDPTSTLLSERANYWASTRGVNFGEALSSVSKAAWNPPVPKSPLTADWRALEKESSDRAVASGVLSPRLAELAWQIARSKDVTFKQALSAAASENPELVAAWVNEQLD